MKLYFDALDIGVGSRPDNSDPNEVLPASFVSFIEVDPKTNAATCSGFNSAPWEYSRSGDTLLHDAAPTAIELDSGEKTALDNMLNQADAAIASNDAYLAIAGTPTNAQVLAQVKDLTRQNTRIIKRLVLIGRYIYG